MQTIVDVNGKHWTGIELAHSDLEVSPTFLAKRVLDLYGKLLDAVAEEILEHPDNPFILDYLERGLMLLGFNEIASMLKTDFLGSAFRFRETIRRKSPQELNTLVSNATAYSLLLR